MVANGDGPRNHPLIKDLNSAAVREHRKAGCLADQDSVIRGRLEQRCYGASGHLRSGQISRLR